MGNYKPDKYTLEVDVDAVRQVNRYTVRSMYDVIDEEGYSDLEQRIVEEIMLSWDEIKKRGGVHVVNKDFQDRYNLE